MFSELQVNLYVEDVERAVGFYRALGAVESFRTPAEGVPDHVEVHLAGVTLGLASVRAARDHHGLDVSSAGSPFELGLWTDDADAAWAALLAAGATPMVEPDDLPNGLRVAWARDLDGNVVHLVQRLA
jgi:lactoylglutathione lyase